MRHYENACALKFLIRILTGMMTKKEWAIYYQLYHQATQQFNQYFDKHNPPYFVKLGKTLAHHTRHDGDVISKGSERKAILLHELNRKGLGILHQAESVMDLAIVVVANSKDRFAFTLDEIKDDQDHSIYINYAS